MVGRASGPISDLYQRYKIGSKRIVQWLAETAAQFGRLEAVVPHVPAFKKADTDTVLLTTKQIEALAHEISSRTNPAKGPPKDIQDIIIVLEDVIAGRREYAIWHAQETLVKDSEYAQRAESHQYFVDVLARVLASLKELLLACKTNVKKGKSKTKASRVQKKHDASIPDDAKVIQSIYKDLEVEETSANDLTESVASVSLKTSGKPRQQKPLSFEMERQEGEDTFALWCLLRDGHDVRRFLRELWQEYRDKNVTIQVASAVTDVAFEILQHAANKFAEEFAHLSSFNQVADHLKISATTTKDQVSSFSFQQPEQAGSSETTVPAEELLCAPAFTGLVLLRESLLPYEGREDVFFDAVDYADSSHEIIRRIGDIATVLSTYQGQLEGPEKYTGFDSFSDFIWTIRPNHPLHIHVVMAFQIYMDILDLIGPGGSSQEPYCSLRNMATSIRCELDRYDTFLENRARVDRRSYPLEDRIFVSKHLRGTLNEVIFKNAKEDRFCASKDRQDFDGTLMAPLYMKLPVLCGIHAHNLAQFNHSGGTDICNYGFFVMAAAHLYFATRKAGLLDTAWEDMEFAVKQLGPSSLGLHDPFSMTGTMLSCARQFGIALGVSVTEYSKERLRQGGAKVRASLPSLERMLKNKPIIDDRSTFISVMYEAVKLEAERGISKEGSLEYALSTLARKLMATTTSGPEKTYSQQWQSCHKLRPTELLAVLKGELLSDEANLFFDYRGLFIQCVTIVDTIVNGLVGDGTWRKPSDDKPASVVASMVDDVLWEAAQIDKFQSLKFTKLGAISRYFKEHLSYDRRLLLWKEGQGIRDSQLHKDITVVQKADVPDKVEYSSAKFEGGNVVHLEPRIRSSRDEQTRGRMIKAWMDAQEKKLTGIDAAQAIKSALEERDHIPDGNEETKQSD